jgi:hypothetical protein
LGTDWDTSVFVGAIWSLTVAVALVLAYRGRRFPNVDEWSLLSIVTGEKPVTLAWLWAPHVVHRIVLPKLIFLALYNSSVGYDFRAGVFLHVFLLGARVRDDTRGQPLTRLDELFGCLFPSCTA